MGWLWDTLVAVWGESAAFCGKQSTSLDVSHGDGICTNGGSGRLLLVLCANRPMRMPRTYSNAAKSLRYGLGLSILFDHGCNISTPTTWLRTWSWMDRLCFIKMSNVDWIAFPYLKTCLIELWNRTPFAGRISLTALSLKDGLLSCRPAFLRVVVR